MQLFLTGYRVMGVFFSKVHYQQEGFRVQLSERTTYTPPLLYSEKTQITSNMKILFVYNVLQGCIGGGTRGNAVPPSFFERERRSPSFLFAL